jgi:lysophospholipase L1-like esterase
MVSIKTISIVVAALVLVAVFTVAIGFANIGLQIKRYPVYWQKQANKSVAINELVYIALGDSTAQGIGASSPARGYVGLLAKRLEQTTNRPVRVINVSVSGAKIADVLQKQISQIEGVKADVVTIEIGANDVRTYNKQQFDAEFSELTKKLPKGTYISDMPRFDNQEARAKAVEMSKTISVLVPAGGHVLVPLFDTTSKNTSLWRNSTDRFHPSNQGYTYWADAFWSMIQKDKVL